MAKTITQKIVFKNTTPARLYNLYMNAREHTESTGGVAEITNRQGAPFTAYDGYITGVNQKLVKGALIVQTWRGSDWQPSDPDSALVLFLEPKGADAVLHMVHSMLPDDQADAIAQGWIDFYWKPWKKYLKAGL